MVDVPDRGMLLDMMTYVVADADITQWRLQVLVFQSTQGTGRVSMCIP